MLIFFTFCFFFFSLLISLKIVNNCIFGSTPLLYSNNFEGP
jgi:hypothetical protein